VGSHVAAFLEMACFGSKAAVNAAIVRGPVSRRQPTWQLLRRSAQGREQMLRCLAATQMFLAASVAHPDPDDAIGDIRNVESPAAPGYSVLGVKMAC
jgi:hypothetical protein